MGQGQASPPPWSRRCWNSSLKCPSPSLFLLDPARLQAQTLPPGGDLGLFRSRFLIQGRCARLWGVGCLVCPCPASAALCVSFPSRQLLSVHPVAGPASSAHSRLPGAGTRGEVTSSTGKRCLSVPQWSVSQAHLAGRKIRCCLCTYVCPCMWEDTDARVCVCSGGIRCAR